MILDATVFVCGYLLGIASVVAMAIAWGADR
jgi:hypothetical protein